MLRLPRNSSRRPPADQRLEAANHKPLTLSALISEWVYWLVVAAVSVIVPTSLAMN